MKADIIKYDFKTGLPQEFEIVDIAELYKKFKDTLTTTHRTGFYHIIWFQRGSPTHFVDFDPIKIRPNTLLFLNKDTVQRFDNETKFGGKAILFTYSFFCETVTTQNFYGIVFYSTTYFRFPKSKCKSNQIYLLVCYS